MTNEQLVARIQAHENEAENMLALWQQNKGFIHKMAIKYTAFAELEDLKQECYIGLCHAVENYDSNQDVSFIHYAAFWMKQAMLRYIDNCCNNVRIPVHARNEILQYKKICEEYRKLYGKEPTEFEMRYFLGVSIDKLESIKKNALAVNIRSLDEPIGGDDEDIMLSDTVASEECFEDDLIKELDTSVMQEALWKVVEELDEDMAAVIRQRYQEKKTLKEVSENLGVSPERARQTEAKALRKLRHPNKCAPFREYFEQYISAVPIYHVGVERFNRTWTSSVEEAVLRW